MKLIALFQVKMSDKSGVSPKSITGPSFSTEFPHLEEFTNSTRNFPGTLTQLNKELIEVIMGEFLRVQIKVMIFEKNAVLT